MRINPDDFEPNDLDEIGYNRECYDEYEPNHEENYMSFVELLRNGILHDVINILNGKTSEEKYISSNVFTIFSEEGKKAFQDFLRILEDYYMGKFNIKLEYNIYNLNHADYETEPMRAYIDNTYLPYINNVQEFIDHFCNHYMLKKYIED